MVCKQLHTEIIQSWTEYWNISPDENQIVIWKYFNKIIHEFMACFFALAQINYCQNTEVLVSLLTITKIL